MGISIEHIRYQYKRRSEGEPRYALDDVTFSIEKGEYVAIIGHTGSGKSTLLQHLNGLLRAEEGSYHFDGEDVYAKGFSMKKLRQKVALCFQYPEYQLFEETILKDIMFGPKNMGFSEEECMEKARNAMKIVGLASDMEDQAPFALSGGQKRRVALAGILAMEPEYLILDEPVAGLDAIGKQRLFDLLQELNEKKHITVILVSHDMDDVADHARRVLVMNQGKLILDGSTREVFAKGELLKKCNLGVPGVVTFFEEMRESIGQMKSSSEANMLEQNTPDQKDVEEILPLTVDELADWMIAQVKRGDRYVS